MNVSDVERLFAEYKHKKIALYGLGTETEKVLREVKNGCEIVGLLDGFRENGTLYGLPILPVKKAIGLGIALIIVVARPASCRAIVKRIGELCRENHVALFDIRGNDLLQEAKETYDFKHLEGVTKGKFTELIGRADVISFDLFDTLVMRRTLYAEDVLEIVDHRLKEMGIEISDFTRRRLAAEKQMSKAGAPMLEQIYERVLEEKSLETGHKGGRVPARQLAELEWKIDYSLIVPRREVCDLFRIAVTAGKKVYIVSDTYYTKRQLEQILEKCRLGEYTDILASCEYETGKTQGLFEILKKKEKKGKILHIGDDVLADMESASKHGITVCRLYSGRDLLEATGGLGIRKYDDTLSDRIRIGMMTAALFNSPFWFETKERRIGLAAAYDIGYVLFAPVIADFVLWFYHRVKEQKIENIWLGARDGYLIKQLYENLVLAHGEADNSVYFLTSRMAAIRSGVQDEQDIRYVESMKFSGSLEENLYSRFHIEVDKIRKEELRSDAPGLLKYEKAILTNAHKARTNYKKYIDGLEMKPGKIAFFDFVAKGTTQMYLQRLTDNHMKGFYFMQLEPAYMRDKGLDIEALYENGDVHATDLYESYYIMEPFMTAPHPSVSDFGENGEPVYAEETRKENDIRCSMKVQQGVVDFFKKYLEICPKADWRTNTGLSGACLGLIHKLVVRDEDFRNMTIEDPFFNRMTKMSDIL